MYDAVVEFTNTSPMLSGYRAHWDFDGSTNDLWSPWKIYDNSGINTKFVTLTITDAYGCSASYTAIVTTVANNLDGTLKAAPTTACSGTPVVLTYTPGMGKDMATSFEWHEQTRYLDSNNSASRAVYEPGGYWVMGIDTKGCKNKTPQVPVDFTHVPDAIITGPTSVCELQTYTLTYPAAVYPAGAVYTWRENGFVTGSSSPVLTRSNFAGTYTYTLEITIPGTGCSDTSAPYTVTVHPTPVIPTITQTVLDCEDYKVQLSAFSPSAGVYNWSSGDAGSPVIVHSGGPYRCWVTDAFGCTSYNDVYVDKSPDIYKYVFPTGCYKLCINEAPFVLLPPKFPTSFTQWDWLRSGVSVASGSGHPMSYSVTAPGTYNFAMEQGVCHDTTDDLDISFKDCPDGCIGTLQLIGITKTGVLPCYDTVILGIGCPPGTTYTITGDNGIFLPATGSGPSGASKFRYIADPGFSGPIEFVTAIFVDPISGMSCRARLPIPIMPCANSTAKLADGEGSSDIVSNELARLVLRPNPASSSVLIDYGFEGKGSQRSIEIYDMAGRQIVSRSVTDAYGSISLQLDEMSSGLYQVILRQDGKVYLHSKLSVVK